MYASVTILNDSWFLALVTGAPKYFIDVILL